MGLWSRIKKTISPDRHSDDIQEEIAVSSPHGERTGAAARRLGYDSAV
jgi:hypothetical protein